ncbi:MAG: hypothetical protein ABS76_13775 [Pelagibacterium sp. SCN 64-44]|nr:MAG: hypothetical protein ABS76_13775 [Pelagibacterium sp. SCN 64-44]
MTENRTEDNGLDGPLTTAERKALTAYLIETIRGWEGETPFQRAPDRDGDELKYPPDLKANRLFPHIGYREASRIGKHFEGAYAVKSRAHGRQRGPKLHLVTLRLNAPPPSPDALDEHLGRLSKVVSQVFDDIQHSTSVPAGTVPLLTALHIRMSDVEPGRFDPHAHAILEIPGDTVSSVRDYLASASSREGDRYFGAAWVDVEPVKRLRNAAFYVAAGVVDYRRLREWPQAALMAVWRLSRRKMLRRAGWFGASPVEDGVETNKDALGSPSPAFGQSHTTTSYQGPPGGIMDDHADRAVSDWRASLFPMLNPYLPAEYARLTKSTVRTVSAGNRNLLAYPTIGETLASAIFVIEAEQRDHDRKYTEVLDAYRFEQKQFEESQRRVESFFHIRLFHPGIGYMPTPEGVIWAKTVMSALEPIIKLAEEGRGRLVDSHGNKDRLGQDLIRDG